MTFYKKLLALTFGSSSVVFVYKSNSSFSPFQKITEDELNSIFDKTRTANIPILTSSNSLHPTYSLFSTNLYTFSNLFRQHFYKWAIFQWADSLLKNTSNEHFVDIKHKVFNALVDAKYSYKRSGDINSIRLDNHAINHAKLDELFKEFIFKEIWINDEKSTLKISDTEASKYGDSKYIQSVSFFLNFIFKRWLEQERPQIVCKKEFRYSTTNTNTQYKNTEDSKTPSYKFPNFDDTTKQQIKQQCSDFSIITINDLDSWSGKEILGYIHHSELEEGGGVDLSTVEDPVDYFLVDDGSSPINAKNAFNDATKGTKAIKNFADSKDSKTFVRTESGLTLFQLMEKSKANLLSQDLNLKKEFNLLNVLKDFFSKHKEELLPLYFNYKASETGGIFINRNWSKEIYDIARYSALFYYHLRNNKRLFNALKTISKFSKDYENVSIENSQSAFPSSFGLAVPDEDRNFSDTEELSEEVWLYSEKNYKNDGTFPKLNNFFGISSKAKAYEYSFKIKESLKNYLNKLSIQSRKEGGFSSYFFNDYIFDNVYKSFLDKGNEWMIKAIKNIYMLNDLGFDFYRNDILDFSSKLLNESKIDYSQDTRDNYLSLIHQSIVSVYYGSLYEKEPMEEKMNYGGYKWNQVNQDKNTKFCRRILKKSVSTSETKNNDDCVNNLEQNRNQYLQKLVDYFLMKNWFYNEYGFELTSDQMTEYLSFLFSFKWLIKNSFKNLKEYAARELVSGDYGVLLWLNKVPNQSESSVGSEDSSSIKDLNKFFSDTEKPDIFNPMYSEDITMSKRFKFSTVDDNHISAFANIGNEEYMEFSGFKGLITPWDMKSLPKSLQQSIFMDFDRSNPSKNKNYATSQKSSSVSFGLTYGYVFSDQKQNISNMIDSFTTIKKLESFIKRTFSTAADEFTEWTNDLEDEQISLAQRKSKLKTLINNSQFQESSQRFIGFLRNPELAKSIYTTTPYFIPNSESGNDGNIVFVTQVNRYDFQEGFNDFVEVISQRTLFKMISLLSLSPRVKNVSIATDLIKRGLFI